MNIWVNLPKIIPTLCTLICFGLCLYIVYILFGIWGALIAGIIVVTASIYLSYKALGFLDKYERK
jgi:chromate transport protein ChrA